MVYPEENNWFNWFDHLGAHIHYALRFIRCKDKKGSIWLYRHTKHDYEINRKRKEDRVTYGDVSNLFREHGLCSA